MDCPSDCELPPVSPSGPEIPDNFQGSPGCCAMDHSMEQPRTDVDTELQRLKDVLGADCSSVQNLTAIRDLYISYREQVQNSQHLLSALHFEKQFPSCTPRCQVSDEVSLMPLAVREEDRSFSPTSSPSCLELMLTTSDKAVDLEKSVAAHGSTRLVTQGPKKRQRTQTQPDTTHVKKIATRKRTALKTTLYDCIKSVQDVGPITVGLSDEKQYPELLAQEMRQFYRTLIDYADPVTNIKPMNEQDAAVLCQYFFVQCSGSVALERIATFVNEYDDPTAIDLSANLRVEKLAKAPDLPCSVRAFWAKYFVASQRKTGDTISKYVSDVQLDRAVLRKFDELCDSISNKDPDIMALCARMQVKLTSPGRGYHSVCYDLLSELSELDNTQLKNSIDAVRGIHTILEAFGPAFILLTPPGSVSFLRHYGLRKIRPATEILKRDHPSFTTITALLHDHLWKPYLDGQGPTEYLRTAIGEGTRLVADRAMEAISEGETVEQGLWT